MKILVTGGAGYIGSHIVKLLADEKYKVIIIDNLKNGHSWAIDKRAKFFKADLKDKEVILKIFQENKIDCVIHLAALIEAGESMKKPALFFRNNLANTLNLLEAMIETKTLNMIFSSTAAVYGEPKYIPIDEKHPKNPVNYYGLSKLMTEQILESYHDAYNLKFISLRYFNAAGADESSKIGEAHNPETHLIPLILQVANNKRDKIYVFGDDFDTKDGSCVRDYIHVNDLAKAHIMAMKKIEKIKKGSFNLGHGKGYSVFEIIDICEKVTGKKIKREISQRRKGDPAILIADYSKAKKQIGWKPELDINKIIKTAWKWEESAK